MCLGRMSAQATMPAPWEKAEELGTRQRAAQAQPVRAAGTPILPSPASRRTAASIRILLGKAGDVFLKVPDLTESHTAFIPEIPLVPHSQTASAQDQKKTCHITVQKLGDQEGQGIGQMTKKDRNSQ